MLKKLNIIILASFSMLLLFNACKSNKIKEGKTFASNELHKDSIEFAFQKFDKELYESDTIDSVKEFSEYSIYVRSYRKDSLLVYVNDSLYVGILSQVKKKHGEVNEGDSVTLPFCNVLISISSAHGEDLNSIECAGCDTVYNRLGASLIKRPTTVTIESLLHHYYIRFNYNYKYPKLFVNLNSVGKWQGIYDKYSTKTWAW